MASIPPSGFGMSSSPAAADPTNPTPLDHATYVENPMVQQNALSTQRYSGTARSLMGFIEGPIMTVTYYRRHHDATVRTHTTDSVFARNVAMTSLTCIENFEFRLRDQLSLDYATDRGEGQMQGQGVFYPGMEPQVGDEFLYHIGDGVIGVFCITSVKPMSWRTWRAYEVSFYRRDYLTDAYAAVLQAATVATEVFDRTIYLGSDKAVTLIKKDYQDVLELRRHRKALLILYFQNFFDPSSGSLWSPEQVYDPYLVRFITQKTSLTDVKVRPRQFLQELLSSYQSTVWCRLTEPFMRSTTGLWPYSVTYTDRRSFLSAAITPLLNKTYRTVINDACGTPHPYIFSSAFYAGQWDAMSPLETIVYHAITRRQVLDIGTFFTDHVETIYTADQKVMFDTLPAIIHIIDIALAQLTNGVTRSA